MMFQETLRDGRDAVGSLTTQIDMRADSGPFVVTQPNTNVSWAKSAQHTVTWNVANTGNAPVSCANVRITLSTDGGNSFPTVLADNTPNDGSQVITLPDVISIVPANYNELLRLNRRSWLERFGATGTVKIGQP